MHPFLSWLLTHHNAHGCLTATPRRWNIKCSIRWPEDSAFRILDCDQCPDFRQGQGQGGKRPDFLLFWERRGRLLVVVLELTRGAVESDKRDQIAEGLRILEGYLARFIDLRFFKVTITTPSRYIGSRKATRQSPFPFVPAKR
jgi:hypothetical protein